MNYINIFFLLGTFLIVPISAMRELIPVQTTFCSSKGHREKQEDAFTILHIQHDNREYLLTAIFDGHSGGDVAHMASRKFFSFFEQKLKENASVQECLKYACSQCEEHSKKTKYEGSGSTILASCFEPDSGNLSILCLGDSRAYVSSGDYNTAITQDHNCDNQKECERVEQEGGKVVNGKLNNLIAVTRSLGDTELKKRAPQLIAQPEYVTWNAYKNLDNEMSANYGFSIEASDGFWNVIKAKDQEVCDYLWDAKNLCHKEFYTKYESNQKEIDEELMSDSDDDHCRDVARRLCYIAVEHLGSTDNTTVIVKLFGDDPFLRNESDKSSDSDDSNESGEDNDSENARIENAILNNTFEQSLLLLRLQLDDKFEKQDALNEQFQKQDERLQQLEKTIQQKEQEWQDKIDTINKRISKFQQYFGGFLVMLLLTSIIHYYNVSLT